MYQSALLTMSSLCKRLVRILQNNAAKHTVRYSAADSPLLRLTGGSVLSGATKLLVAVKEWNCFNASSLTPSLIKIRIS